MRIMKISENRRNIASYRVIDVAPSGREVASITVSYLSNHQENDVVA